MDHTFLNSETGAVTVDWVVLTASLVGVGLAVVAAISGGVEDLSTDTRDHMTGIQITDAFDTSFIFSGYLWRAEGDWGTRLDTQMDEYRDTDTYPANVLENILDTQLREGEEA